MSLPQGGAPATAVGAIAGLLSLFAVANVATFLNPHWMERLVEELRRRLTLIWTLQVVSFLLPALLWLVAPGVIVDSLSDGTGEDARLGTDAVHLIGPMAVAMATASVLALSRVEADFRRSIARAFVVWFGIWLLVVVYNMTGEFGQQPSRFTTAGVAALVPVALFFVPNLLVAYGATGRLRADLYAGSADSRPRGWFLWHQLQALVAFAGALLVGFFPEKAAHWMLRESARYDLASWELDQLRIHASYSAFLWAMSLLAAVQLRRWAWRQFGRWFAGWSLLWAVIFVYDYDSDIYSPAMMLLWAAVGVMGLVQAYFLSRPTVVEDLGVADSPEGLIWPDPVAAVPMAIQTATTRRRASHLYGVGAAGRLHCLRASSCPSGRRAGWRSAPC